jgi:hypothetical protein
MMEFPQAKR